MRTLMQLLDSSVIEPAETLVNNLSSAVSDVTSLVSTLESLQVERSAASLIAPPDEWPSMRRDEIPAIYVWISKQPALAGFFDGASVSLQMIDPNNVLKKLAILCALATIVPNDTLADLANDYTKACARGDGEDELRDFLRLANQLLLAQRKL